MSDDTLTAEEVAEIRRLTRELQEAKKAEDRAPAGSAAETRAEARVESAEDRLRRVARETGVSYETLARAAEEEEQAKFNARMDAYLEAKGLVRDEDPAADEDKPDSDADDDTPKGPKLPPKGAKTPDERTEDKPDDAHWSDKPLWKRKGAKA